MSARKAFLLAVKAEMVRQGIERRELARRLDCTLENVYQMFDSKVAGMGLARAEKEAKALKCDVFLLLMPRSRPAGPMFAGPDKSAQRKEPELPVQPSAEQRRRWGEAARIEGLARRRHFEKNGLSGA